MGAPEKAMLAALVIGSALRIVFVWHQPFTNDEGAYLFDAKLLTEGKIPGGDVLTKTPVTALLFTSSVWLTNGSLFASRLVSVLASLLMLIPLAWVAYRMSGKTAAIIAVLLGLLAVPIPMQVLGITETIAIFFTVAFLALWWLAVAPQKYLKRPWLAGVVAGMLFGLAFTSRKTSMAVLVPALYLWLLAPRKQREQIVLPALAGVAVVILPWIIVMHYLYGPIGVREALGVGYGDIWQEETLSIAGKAGIGWAAAVLGRVGSGAVIAAVIGFGWAALKLYRKQLIPTLPLVWFLTLVGLYIGWPTFLPEYFIDFFAPATLLAALAIAEIQKHWPRWGLGTVAVILIAAIGSMWSAYAKPWTGMFTQGAAREAAILLQQHVPADEPVFTAAVLIPYLSGHGVVFNISHPLWYRYDFIPSATKDTFLPPLNIVEREIQEGEVRWALIEHLTDYAYLRSETHLISLFEQQWELVTTIPNDTGFRSNTLKIYRRTE